MNSTNCIYGVFADGYKSPLFMSSDKGEAVETMRELASMMIYFGLFIAIIH